VPQFENFELFHLQFRASAGVYTERSAVDTMMRGMGCRGKAKEFLGGPQPASGPLPALKKSPESVSGLGRNAVKQISRFARPGDFLSEPWT
jgi:hypothetical protein